MKARIAAIDYYLPSTILDNSDLVRDHPDWKVDRLSKMTGITSRHVAAPDEFSSDLAVGAGRAMFESAGIRADEIDYLIVCTQSPDYFLPTTACLVQDALGLRRSIGAVDVTLGCSGFVYSLGLAKGLIESGQVDNVLIITVETHSKFANVDDKSTRPIFGDGAAATFVVGDSETEAIGGVNLGTDGSGGHSLVVPNGGLREVKGFSKSAEVEARALDSNGYDMYMDGLEIFNFTLRVVPSCVERVLTSTGMKMEDIDLFVFHQANAYLIEHLRKKLEIPEEKFVLALDGFGNTGSSTIPIALTTAIRAGRVKVGDRIMLVGFGVGLSWGGLMLTW